MRWRDIGDLTCSVARALSVVGDRWTLLILRDAFLGFRRFEDFESDLGMTRHRLADRLRKLVGNGILERVRYQDRPARFEYRITEKGRDLYPVVVSLTRWGDRWMAGDDGPPLELVHRNCGQTIVPVLTCPACGDRVVAREMQARPGPALRREIERRAQSSDRAVPRAASSRARTTKRIGAALRRPTESEARPAPRRRAEKEDRP